MIVLLDTNAFVWWMLDDPRLGTKAKKDIATPSNDIYVSNISLLECSIKVRLGKLKIDFDVVDQEKSEGRLFELRYDTLAARQFVSQTDLPHSDPFDIALISQAVSKHMILMTSDEHILDTSIDGLQVIDARK
ncbi:MAG: type II toxin-antitoxin system VapC family toxin [Candidatus Saccharimonadales bacterium]